MFGKNKNKHRKKDLGDDDVMLKPRQIVALIGSEKTDPNGSYTGKPTDHYEKPVQDADDL